MTDAELTAEEQLRRDIAADAARSTGGATDIFGDPLYPGQSITSVVPNPPVVARTPMSAQKTITVPLTTPIVVSGAIVDRLTFREPNLGDLIASERSGGGTHMNSAIMMSRMAGVTEEEMQAVSYADYVKLDAALQPLMGNDGAAAGGVSSPS